MTDAGAKTIKNKNCKGEQMYISFTLNRMKSAVVILFMLYMTIWATFAIHGSELIIHELDSKEIARNTLGISSIRRFQVYLPDGYAESDARYQVLYWLPGWSGSLNGGSYKKSLDDAIQNSEIPPTIAVFIDGYDRFMQGILFLNSSMFGNWGNFLISEVIPFVDREYRTIPNMVGRGLMGWSAGGYSSIILPILHPNVWGAVGTNDACPWLACNFGNMPGGDILDEYPKASLGIKSQMQIGAAVAPNPDVAIGFDWPRKLDIKKKWDAYCPMRQETIAQNKETLNNLLKIALVVPENPSGSCRGNNLTMIQLMEAEGISVTQLDSPGSHNDHNIARYIAVVEQLLKAMVGAETSVSPRRKMAALWGEIKQGG